MKRETNLLLRLKLMAGFAVMMMNSVEFTKAQTISATTYPFTSSSGIALEDMSTGTTQILGPGWDNGISAVTPIGFDFYFVGKYYDQFSINSNGLMKLNSALVPAAVTGESTNSMATSNNLPKIAPYWDNLSTGSNGKLHYKITGTAPSRKLVIEWFNLTIPRVIGGLGAATFQVWLHEGTGIIEFVYGSGMISNSAGYSIGIGNTAAVYASVTTSTPSCAYGTANNSNTVAIASGTKYTFTPIQTLVNPPVTLSTVSPPSASTINIQWIDNSTNETSFHVFRSTDSINYVYVATVASTTVAGSGSIYNFNNASLNSATPYYFRVIASNEGIASTSLQGSFTTSTETTYEWLGAGSCADGNWTTASNWNPARNTPDPTDKLLFNCGGNVTVTSVPTQSVSRLTVTGHTTINLQSAATSTLTVTSDNNAGTYEIEIADSSSLIINSTNVLNLVFGGSGSKATIAGRFEINNTNLVNTFNLTGAVVTVEASGVLAGGSTVATYPWTGASTTTLIIHGTYEHKYTTVFGTIPTAKWEVNSNCNIIGYTTASAPFADASFAQTFYNFTWNCQNQDNASNLNLVGNVPTILGTFYVVSTGSGISAFRLAGSTTNYTKTWNNYIQTGGIFDFGNTSTGIAIINITGTLNQSGGIFRSSNIGTSGTPATLNFQGSSGQQSVNFHDAAPSGPITYRISNPDGINLTGSGTLNSTFAINKLGGIRISTTAANPINTSLTFAYNGKWTTLTYDAIGSYSITPETFPPTVGPSNLTIAVGSGNVLTMPFSRSLSPADTNGVLTLSSGLLDIGNNNLTLGTSAAFPGTLVYTAPSKIRCGAGSVTRWYGTTNLPTVAGGTSIGWYPLIFENSLRDVSVYFNSPTALSAGGTITVSHSSGTLFTTGLSIIDGSYTIQQRTNAFWLLNAGNGMTLSGSLGIRITAGSLFFSGNPSNLRLMKATSVAGNQESGGGVNPNFTAQRSGLTIGDITAQNYYIGSATGDMNPIFTAISSGNWSDGSTWDQGVAPGSINIAVIPSGVNVSLDPNATNECRILTINSGGTLTADTGQLNVDSTIVNSGNIIINGGSIVVTGGLSTTSSNGIINNAGSTFTFNSGTVTIGPMGGGNKIFSTSGVTQIHGGSLYVNGAVAIGGGNVSQTGGSIIIDGNSGISSTSTTSILFHISSASAGISFTGGSITLVDPPFGSQNSITIVQSGSASNAIAFSGTHSWLIGDGISSTAGGINGFVIECFGGTGRIPLQNVTINGSAGTNRFARNTLSTAGGTIFKGTFTVNAGSEFRWNTDAAGDDGYMGNVLNNGTIISTVTTAFGIPADMVASGFFSTNGIQAISGTGSWMNAASSPTAEVAGIYLNNPNGLDISALSGTFRQSGLLTFASGKIITGNVIYAQVSGATVIGAGQTTGWIDGNFQKNVATGSSVIRTFEVGSNNYSPLSLNFASVSTASNLIVSSTSGDHPQLPASYFADNRSVNRYWTVDNSQNLIFTTAALTLTWQVSENDPGLDSINLSVGRFTNLSSWESVPVNGIPGVATISTANSIVSFGDFVVAENCQLPSIDVIATDISCNGQADGSIHLMTSGGIPPFSYSWTGPNGFAETTQNIDALNAGSYSLVITASGGCSDTIDVMIHEPGLLTATAMHTNVNCFGGNDGTITIFPSGGTPPYAYSIDNGGTYQASATFNNLTPGTYEVAIKDSNECSYVVGNETLTQPASLPSFTYLSTDATCHGYADGSITFTASGGMSPYEYSVDSGITFNTLATVTSLSAGNYFLVVRDMGGCLSAIQPVLLGQPSELSFSVTVINATCINGTDGSIFISNVIGGEGGPYEYSADNGGSWQSDSTLANLSAGIYQVRVRDASGCASLADAIQVGTSPVQYNISAAAGAGGMIGPSANVIVDCGNDQQFTIMPDDCYQIDSVIIDGINAGSISSYDFVNVISNHTISAYFSQITYVIAATAGTNGTIMPPGNTSVICGNNQSYFITANMGYVVEDVLIDGNSVGSISTYNFINVHSNHTISATFTTCTNPAEADAGSDQAICAGENASLSGNIGGGATEAFWQSSGSGTFMPDSTFGSASFYIPSTADIAAGSVYLILTTDDPDNSGPCPIAIDSLVLTINPTPQVAISGNLQFCAGDTNILTAQAFTANGGTISYQWTLNSSTTLGTDSTQMTLAGGFYAVTVSNNYNCSATSTATVVQNNLPAAPVITASGPTTFCQGDSVELSSDYTTGNSWIPSGQTTQNIFVTMSGVFAVKHTDVNGCSATSASINITVQQATVIILSSNDLCDGSGDSALLTAIANPPAVEYFWSTMETTDNILVTQPGSYSVTTSDGNGCMSSATVSVLSNAVPGILISGAQTLCTGVPIILTATVSPGSGTLVSVKWYRDNMLADSGLMHSATVPGTFTVVAVNSNGCSSVSDPFILMSSGPLSGNYTIGAGQASCSNYLSFSAAFSDLNAKGVNGPVSFAISDGYTETAPSGGLKLDFCMLSDSLKPSSTKPVTFTGGVVAPVITAPVGTSGTSDGIVLLIGCDYITFDNVSLQESASNASTTTRMEWGYALLKCDGTDGANHNVIRNCNITLNKANVSTTAASVGIYMNNHTAANTTALVYSGGNTTADSSKFRSSNNRFYGNNIQNVYRGIFISGSSVTELFDQENRIGSDSFPGNVISNWGGGNIASGPIGILATLQDNCSILNNTINGGAGTSNSQVTGISYTGSLGGSVSGNNITITSSNTTQTCVAIISTTAGQDRTLTINNNIIENCTWTTVTTGLFIGIRHQGASPDHLIMRNNQVRNNSVTPSGATASNFIGIANNINAISSITMSNNNVTGNIFNGTGTFTGIECSSSPPVLYMDSNVVANNTKGRIGTMSCLSFNTPGTARITYNAITGNTITGGGGATTLNCAIGSTSSYDFSNNDIESNSIVGMTGSSIAIIHGYSNITLSTSETLENNRIRKLSISGTSTASHAIRALYLNGSPSSMRNVYHNIIDSLFCNSTSSAVITAITSANASVSNIHGNKIYDLFPGQNSGVSSAKGILTSNGATTNIYNNLIQVHLPSSPLTSNTAVTGIEVGSVGTNANIYFNTIRLSGNGTGTAFGSSGIWLTSALTNTDLRNNIVINLMNAGGGTAPASAVALRRSGVSLSGYASTSNRNIWNAGSASSSHLLHYDGTNSDQTLAAFKSHVGTRESQSWTENVAFQSTAGADVHFLKVDTSIATFVEGGAEPITSPVNISTDYFATSRNANSPDIGAHEADFINAALVIKYAIASPATGQCTSMSHVITTEMQPATNPISSVILNYAFDGFPQPGIALSNGGSGNVYSGVIPAATPSNAVVTWSISVQDGMNTITTTGLPYQDEYLLAVPFHAMATPNSFCSGLEAILSVDSLQGFTYSWTDGINQISQSTSFTVSPVITTTYTVTITDQNGCSKVEPVTVTVNPVPDAPQVTNSVQCGIGIPAAMVAGGGGIFNWYLSAAGGSPLPGETSNLLTAYSINETTLFYVSEFDGLCEGQRSLVTATVTQPDSVVASSQDTICGNAPLQLTATQIGMNNSYQYTWTAQPALGSGLEMPDTGQAITVFPTIGGTYVYTLSAHDVIAECNTSATVTVVVQSPPVIAYVQASADTICAGTQIGITASACTLCTDYKEGFEVFPFSGFAMSGTGVTPTQTATYYSEGMNALRLVPVNSASGLYAMTTSIDLSLLTNPKLRFSHICATEANADFGRIQYSLDNGATWTMFPTGSYLGSGVLKLGVVGFDKSSYSDWNSQFTSIASTPGTSPATSLWKNETINLADYDTSTQFRIRFVFTTSASNVYYGWLIDNIRFTSDQGTGGYTWLWNPGNVSGNVIQVAPNATTTYMVTATDPFGCTSTASKTIVVNPLPAPPIANDSVQCGYGVPTASVSGGGGIHYWYLNPSGNSPLVGENGTALSNYFINTTTTFYVSEFDGTCEGNRIPVTAFVNQPDAVTAQADQNEICLKDTVHLSVVQTGSTNNYSFNWNSSDSGSGLNGIKTGSQISIVPAAPGTFNYLVTATDSVLGCTFLDTIQIVVHDLPVIITSKASLNQICAGTSVTLSAYTGSTGPMSGQIGTSTTTFTAGQPNPYYTTNWSNKNQYLILASELTAAGLTAGSISSLGFRLGSSTTTLNLNNFTIKMGHTSLTSLPVVFQSGLTTVCLEASYPVQSHNNSVTNHAFNVTPFVWNGVSNIIVETCFTNSATSGQQTIFYTATSFTSAIYHSNNVPTVCSAPGTPLTSTNRPNIYLNGISLIEQPGSFIWQWNPGAIAGNVTTVTPTVTTTYTVSALDTITGCSNQDTAHVNVYSGSVAPIITSSIDTSCSSATTTLTWTNVASTATIQWQNSLDGIVWNNIISANNPTYVSPPLTISTYFRAIISCSTLDTSNVKFVFASNPAITTVNHGSRCGEGIVALTATGTGTIEWFANSTGGTAIATGLTFSPYVATTTTYWVQARIGSCFYSGGRQPVSATVNAAPVVVIDANPNDSICKGSVAQLLAVSSNSGYTYSWSVDQINILFAGNPYTFSGDSTRTYYLLAQDTSGGMNSGCIFKTSINIVVNPVPVQPVLSQTNESICSAGGMDTISITNIQLVPPVQYSWTPATGLSTSLGSTTVASPSSSTVYTVTSTIVATGCTSSATISVSYDPVSIPMITALSDTICQGVSISLDAGSGYATYNWSDGITNLGINQTQLVAPETNATYSVVVSNGGICTASDTIDIITLSAAIPVITANGPTTFCEGGSVSLDAGTGYVSYSWNDGISNVGMGQSYLATTTDTFVITVEYANGCFRSAAESVTVNPNPPSAFILASGSTTLCDDGSNSPLMLSVDTTGLGGNIIVVWNDLLGATGPAFDVYWNDFNLQFNGNSYGFNASLINEFGCTSVTDTIPVNTISCNIALNLKAFLQGYYLGGGTMQSVLFNQGVPGAIGNETDTIYVELRDSLDPTTIISNTTALLMTDGIASCTFACSPGNYWIVIKHRNTIQTWSFEPIAVPGALYDFTASATQAFGANMIDPFGENYWALFTGDINQDEFIDIFDFPDYDLANQNFISFEYVATDLNGDGYVDIFDFPLFDLNNQNFIFAIHP